MYTVSELVNEMNRLIDSARQNQIQLRAFGGLAVFVHSQNDQRFFKRDEPDFDFLVSRNDRQKLEPFFRTMGYSPDKQFNILNGMRRQIYHYDDSGFPHVDILVGDFEMCHKIPLDGRLEIDPVTIPLADLLLSKAQVVELNRKDALDIISLLHNNEMGAEAEGAISLERIVSLCSQDWGLYKTISINLARVEELISSNDLELTSDERDVIIGRVRQVNTAFDEMPKSLAWQMRDKVGTRVRWYLEVEEVEQ